MSLPIASILNYLVSIGLFAFGIAYISKKSFMSYHNQAVSVQWDEIGRNMQNLILALMKTIGGGFISTAFAIASLQYWYVKERLLWIPLIILVVGIISYGASLYAQILIRKKTAGRPPTAISVLGMFVLVVAYILNII